MKSTVIPLSNECKEIILGSLLGEGSLKIHSRYTTPRFSFKHSLKQADYFNWKVSKMSEISSENCHWLQKSDGFGGEKLRYQSLTDKRLTEIFLLTSKKGKKVVTRKWLNQLSALSLAVWWMDDGSIVANGRHGVFCTDSYTLKEIEVIRKYVQVIWGIKTHIGQVRRPDKIYYRLYIRSSLELQAFLRIILPYINVPAMFYKADIQYKDKELQQRWISEIAALSGYTENDIVRSFRQRKKDK